MRRRKLWVPTMRAELEVMDKKKVWDIIDLDKVSAGKKLVNCIWVYMNKYNMEGEIVKWKAHLVAKEYTQV